MRYFIRLAYDGSNYHGWQRQPNGVTVQERLESALTAALRRPTEVTGAGRTDAGVNAAMMIAHFDTPEPIADPVATAHSLNGILKSDIAVQAIFPVADDAHARFDATSRTYKYFVATEKLPFRSRFSWRCPFPLDFGLMNQAAAGLPGHSDFTSFSKLHTDTATNLCRVSAARWEREGELWAFTITADRFLRNMVRAIVGTLVEVGRRKITVGDFGRIIDARDRCAAGASMPGNALFLWKITYPYQIK